MSNTDKTSNKIQTRKKKRIFRTIFSIICSLSLIIILCLIVFLFTIYNNQTLISFFGNSFIYVLSDSMNPEFKKGDVVFIKSCAPEDLRCDDIIAFYKVSYSSGTTIYFHRIIEINYNDDVIYFQTKGDANKIPDPGWVTADRIIGIYRDQPELIRRFFRFAVTAEGNIFFIIIPCGVIFMVELLNLINWTGQEQAGEDGGFSGGKTGVPRKEKSLTEILKEIEEYKSKPCLTAAMLMKQAVLLEMHRNSGKYKDDVEKQLAINEALNWCYDKIGGIKYT